jgi:hypothetical protein
MAQPHRRQPTVVPLAGPKKTTSGQQQGEKSAGLQASQADGATSDTNLLANMARSMPFHVKARRPQIDHN